MRRYIDADKLTEAFVKAAKQVGNIGDQIAFRMMINEIPAADVVEVVRCKDCKHKPNGYTDDDVLRYPNFPHEENNPCPCQVYEDKWYSWIPNDDSYCSYGERADK